MLLTDWLVIYWIQKILSSRKAKAAYAPCAAKNYKLLKKTKPLSKVAAVQTLRPRPRCFAR